MRRLVGDKSRTLLAVSIILFVAVSAAMFVKLYPTTFFPCDDQLYGRWIDTAVDDYREYRAEHGVALSLLKAYNARDVRAKNSYIMLSAVLRVLLEDAGVRVDMDDFMMALSYVFWCLAVVLVALFLYAYSRDARLVALYLALNVVSPFNFTHLTMYSYPTIELFFVSAIIGLLCVVLHGLAGLRYLRSLAAMVGAALLSAFSLFMVANMVVFMGAVVVAFALAAAVGALRGGAPYSFMSGAGRLRKVGVAAGATLLFVALTGGGLLLIEGGRVYITDTAGGEAKEPLWVEAKSLVDQNIELNHFVTTGAEPCDYGATFFIKYLTNVEPFFFLMLVAGAVFLVRRREEARGLINNVYAAVFVVVSAISLSGVAVFAGYPLLRSVYPAVGGLTIFAAYALSRGLAFRGPGWKGRVTAALMAVLLAGHVLYSGFYIWRQYDARYSLMRYIEDRGGRKVYMLMGDPWSIFIPYFYSIKVVSRARLMEAPDEALLLVGPRRYYGVVQMSDIYTRFRAADLLPALGKAKPVASIPFYSHDPAYLMQDEVAICESYYHRPSWLFKQNPAFSDQDYRVLVYRVGDLRGR